MKIYFDFLSVFCSFASLPITSNEHTMTLESKEHHDLMNLFEQQFKTKPTREAKEFWKHSVYCDGQINRDFMKFREGYSLAKHLYQSQD